MTIWIDKMPTNCAECRLNTTTYYPGYDMRLYSCCIDHHPRNIKNPNEMKDLPCPLESIAEHDVEVKKQTCGDLVDYVTKQVGV